MLKSKVSVLEKSSLTLSTNCKSINEKVVEMEIKWTGWKNTLVVVI